MAYYEEVWFWLIIIGVILVIAALIAWGLTLKKSTPWWIWLLLAVGVLLVFIALPVYVIYHGTYEKAQQLANQQLSQQQYVITQPVAQPTVTVTQPVQQTTITTQQVQPQQRTMVVTEETTTSR